MVRINCASRATLIIAGGMMLVAAATSTAEAQSGRDPRVAVAATPKQALAQKRALTQRVPRREPGWNGGDDPRVRTDFWRSRGSWDQRVRAQSFVYVPVPSYGYGYGYGSGYYDGQVFGSVADANGRPLWANYDAVVPPAGAYGYTPDLSGAPYAVTNEGLMVVEFPSGARRAFPSCVEANDQRDPQGRPRTIFYKSPDYWMILRPGQRGRVQGEPPEGAKACYAIDSVGRVVLRY
ncbi:MAG: hypothetical protein DMD35_03265 [Gemmatimonadetes bacterium]|nr:MAG: hypothetical protein DMD35_03265 [Gemmatimonadota bacterium]